MYVFLIFGLIIVVTGVVVGFIGSKLTAISLGTLNTIVVCIIGASISFSFSFLSGFGFSYGVTGAIVSALLGAGIVLLLIRFVKK